MHRDFLCAPALFHLQEETGEDGTADAVPGAADGTGEYSEGLGGEEVAGKHSGQACVLHTDLDGDGTFLRL